ncbi:alanine racemase [Virgibacillus kekensis]|uniref:Alanine racemase n=1 Tax=Virgibacillus kekensis TaxID=202261 RepID=A0ABV9DLU7_9BACI
MHHGSYRDTWTEISLDAIRENVLAFKDHIGSHTNLMAVIKADAYGHGVVEVAEEVIAAGADYLAVALLDEAIQLREAGIESPLLVLGYTPPEAVEAAIKYNITLTVFTDDVAGKIKAIAESTKMTTRVHLKIDSGMNRIGINNREDALQLVELLKSDYVFIEGIFTHFADADNPDSAYTEKQFKKFNEITGYVEQHVSIPIKHCCNTAATIAFPKMHLDMVRVGIGLYGLYPAEHLKEIISLKKVMSLKTKPVFIKKLEANEAISYGLTYKSEKESIIATLPIGYADGLSRSLSNRGHVTIHGKHAPIVGRICMDQSMIDITGVDNVDVNDTITVFGEPAEGFIAMEEVADLMNTIHYETACLIGKRVPRVYIKEGKIWKKKGLLSKEYKSPVYIN